MAYMQIKRYCKDIYCFSDSQKLFYYRGNYSK